MSTIDVEDLLPRIDALVAQLSKPQIGIENTLWDGEEIADWLHLSASTVKQRVVCQPGFPKPVQPGGSKNSQPRWFASEVITWARENRGTLPTGRRGRAKAS